ncbi:hypothetical protein Q1695_010321 [Nippostrongylus brasiliensis]|nr:hypothetical protein Q1695_010321 [Nippostrongylus brasiliensis]
MIFSMCNLEILGFFGRCVGQRRFSKPTLAGLYLWYLLTDADACRAIGSLGRFILPNATSTTRRKVASICNGSTGSSLVKDTRKGMGAGGAPAELAEERRPLWRLRFPSSSLVGRRMTFWLFSAISERFWSSSRVKKVYRNKDKTEWTAGEDEGVDVGSF